MNDTGFNPASFSKKQICWLKHTAQKENIFIQHSLNVGEKRIGNFRVDGFCEQTNTVYEFQGCWFHGCPRCYNPDAKNTFKMKTMKYLLQQTREKTKFIKDQGYNYVEIWEHEGMK